MYRLLDSPGFFTYATIFNFYISSKIHLKTPLEFVWPGKTHILFLLDLTVQLLGKKQNSFQTLQCKKLIPVWLHSNKIENKTFVRSFR